jgi:hypothetical protein
VAKKVKKEKAMLQRVIAFISKEEIAKLFTSPVQILPAPGPGKFINVVLGILRYKFGTVPYVSNGSILLFLGNPAAYNALSFAMGINETSDKIEIEPFQTGQVGPPNFGNQGLFAQCGVAADPTGGDGSYKITVLYMIEDIL